MNRSRLLMATGVFLFVSVPAAAQSLPASMDAASDTLPSREFGESIINGEDAVETDYPMTGGLLVDTYIDMGSYGAGRLQSFICSSTLIAPDVVLLAAHCVDPDALTYGMGELSDTEYVWSRQADLSRYDGSRPGMSWPDDAVAVADFSFHPDWNIRRLQLGLEENFDIALLFLAEPVLDVQPALLPSAAEASTLAEGTELVVVGWGQQSATSSWEAPPAGSYMYKQMGESYIAEIAAEEFQVGLNESDVRKCHGDSGGPSFAWVGQGTTETMRLVGVTSHAYDDSDCFETGGVDTRVDYYLSWIDSEMRARCEDGTRAWCDEPGILPVDYYEPEPEPEPEDEGDDVDGGSSGDDDSKGGCATLSSGMMGGFGLALAFAAVVRRRV